MPNPSDEVKKIFGTMLSESTSLGVVSGANDSEKRSNLAKEVLSKVSLGVYKLIIMNEKIDPIKFSNAIFDMFSRTGFNLTNEQLDKAGLKEDDKFRIAASLQIALEKAGLLHQHLGSMKHDEKIKRLNTIINTLAPDKERLEKYKNDLQQSLGIENITAGAKPPLKRTDTVFENMPVYSSTPKSAPKHDHAPAVDLENKGRTNPSLAVPSYGQAAPAAKIVKIKKSTRESSSRRTHSTPQQRALARQKGREELLKNFAADEKKTRQEKQDRLGPIVDDILDAAKITPRRR